MPDMKMPARGKQGKGGPAVRAPKGTFKRIIRSVFKFYPKMMTLTLILIVVNAIISSLPTIFMQRIFSIIGDA